jgi:hypothetical protein
VPQELEGKVMHLTAWQGCVGALGEQGIWVEVTRRNSWSQQRSLEPLRPLSAVFIPAGAGATREPPRVMRADHVWESHVQSQDSDPG